MQIEILHPEGLSARMRIREFHADQWRSEYPRAGDLRRALEAQGLDPELLDDAAVEKAHGLLSADLNGGASEILAQVLALDVAGGIPPRDEEVDGLMFHKSYLSSREEIDALKVGLLEEGYEKAASSQDPACRVDVDEAILSFKGVKPGQLGRDVFGAVMPFKSFRKSLPDMGRSIHERGTQWVASKKGILVLEENVLKILGPGGQDGLALEIAPDKMSVRLILRKTEDDDFTPTAGLIQNLVAKHPFARPPAPEKIAEALGSLLNAKESLDVVILKGIPCKAGRNGAMKILVSAEPELPDPESPGKIDFKAFSFFRTARKGDILANVIPPLEGSLGFDVFGNPVPPEAVFPFSQPLGKNTVLTGPDSGKVAARCDGRLVVVDGVPDVVETLKVGEDISLKTGNVKFPGAVEVEGDVRDNLEIHAHGDVDIGGTVEDGSVISSEGAIVIRGGFSGTGRGVIRSKLSSVTIGHIRNQRIESHSNIVVYNEAMSAQLYAKNAILVKGAGKSVVGGHLMAYACIEIFNAGNPAGFKTLLEVGKDFEVERELKEKTAARKEAVDDLDFLQNMLAKLENMARWKEAQGDTRLLKQRVQGMIRFLGEERQRIDTRVQALQARVFNPGECHILVRGTAFPGTMLRYRDQVYPVREAVQGKRWIFRGGTKPRES